jgi:hypothetical protein
MGLLYVFHLLILYNGRVLESNMNYVLYNEIPYYICISFEVLSMYIIWVFIDCPLWTDLISVYKPDVLFVYCIYKVIIICILLSKLILFCAYCYVSDYFYVHFGGSLEYWIKQAIDNTAAMFRVW